MNASANAGVLSHSGSDANAHANAQKTQQYSAFYVHKHLYGIDVQSVQEVVKPMPVTPVPHAPPYVIGLINLRGQIATAVGLLELFETGKKSTPDMMNIICNIEGNLISLMVDEIGDVLEMTRTDFEETPATVPVAVARLLEGVFKTKDALMSVVSIEKVAAEIGIKKKS